MKQKLKRLVSRRRVKKALGDPAEAAKSGVPYITNDSIAAHREQVLSSARKYIYPLQHSKHRIVLITTGLIIAALVVFFSYCTVALYRLQNTSTFLYRVTQVIPFPVAKAGPNFVSYENYLFELRHYMYFYQNQQKLDFNSKLGKQQLVEYKKHTLDQVINDAYAKGLAKKYKVTVSNREVDDQITVLQRQNRLGGSQQAYEDALKQNFGWSIDDFKREVRQRLLEQKVVTVLDIDTKQRAEQALAEIRGGADFGAVAAKYTSDPAGKAANGDFGQTDKANPDLLPQTIDVLFKLQPGQVSDIVNTGYSLEIIKNIETNGDKVHGAHIVFNFQDITKYINDLKDKQKASAFIAIKQ